MGSKATDVRALLDRLFRVATDKGWASEALVYNQLAEEWPHLLERARTPNDASAEPATGDLFAQV
jgi:putative DNA methylase